MNPPPPARIFLSSWTRSHLPVPPIFLSPRAVFFVGGSEQLRGVRRGLEFVRDQASRGSQAPAEPEKLKKVEFRGIYTHPLGGGGTADAGKLSSWGG